MATNFRGNDSGQRAQEAARQAQEAARQGQEAARRGMEAAQESARRGVEAAQEAARRGREAAQRGQEAARLGQEAVRRGQESAQHSREARHSAPADHTRTAQAWQQPTGAAPYVAAVALRTSPGTIVVGHAGPVSTSDNNSCPRPTNPGDGRDWGMGAGRVLQRLGRLDRCTDYRARPVSVETGSASASRFFHCSRRVASVASVWISVPSGRGRVLHFRFHGAPRGRGALVDGALHGA